MATEAQHQAIRAAERAIQAILHDLEIDIGGEVVSVDVDTREFANFATNIWTSADE